MPPRSSRETRRPACTPTPSTTPSPCASTARGGRRATAPTARGDFWEAVAVLDVPAGRAGRQVGGREDLRARAAHADVERPRRGGDRVRRAARTGHAIPPCARGRAWGSRWRCRGAPTGRRSRASARIPTAIESLLESPVVQAGVERWARALGRGARRRGVRARRAGDAPDAAQRVRHAGDHGAHQRPSVRVLARHRREHDAPVGAGRDRGGRRASRAPDTLALGVVAGHIPARAVLIDSLALGPGDWRAGSARPW